MKMSKLTSSPVARGILAAAAAVACAASASAVLAAADAIGSEHFAPGWQAQSEPLINRGIANYGQTNKTLWKVPNNMPRGHYVLINRQGDKAEVIDGYSFDVTSATYRDINLTIPSGYGYVEALPERFLPEVKPAEPVRFEEAK
jgi:hypothetical protein